MIQIIKKGKSDTYVAVCPFCGCKFTYQDDDLHHIDHVTCQNGGCGNIITINKNLVSFEDLEEMNLNA